jgi:serine/threonine-protein kinase
MEGAPVREGEVLAGKYRVDRVLGVGGMGVVVAATHLQLDQKVALKFMLREAFQDAEALARFQREARAAVRLKSEHVARVSDTGTFENGSPYIVMEYLEGTDLSKELETKGALPPQIVAEYIIQACDALAEAHLLGIVHRDLKPANLFITRRPDGSPLVKVLDFGISKASALTDPSVAVTRTSAMLGSPLYMSPEQIRSSKDVDPRSDVWSLGIIMYELLGGRVPFMADTLGGLLTAVVMDPLRPLSEVRPDLPPALTALVARCLEKPVDARCKNVAEIARALAPFCPRRSQPIAERVSALFGDAPNFAGTQSMSRTGSQPPSSSIPVAQPQQMFSAATPMPNAPPQGISTVDSWGTTGKPATTATGVGGGTKIAIAAAVAVVAFVVVGGAFSVYRMKLSGTAKPTASASSDTVASAPPPSSDVATSATTASAATASSAAIAPSASPSASVATPSSSSPTNASATKQVPVAIAQPKPTTKPAASAAKPPSATPAPNTPTPAPSAAPTVKKPGMMDTSN